MRPKETEMLSKGLSIIGIRSGARIEDAFSVYLGELQKWNEAYSLTSIRDERDIVIKHFLDSCLYIKAIPEACANIADVGSGAGFPGIPLKIIAPELDIALVEPSGKKAAFLRNAIRKLGLKGIRVIENGIERVRDEAFDAALTRALWDISDFVKKAGHAVREGGVFILSKGPSVDEELKAVEGRLAIELMSVALPFADAVRNFVIVKKNG